MIRPIPGGVLAGILLAGSTVPLAAQEAVTRQEFDELRQRMDQMENQHRQQLEEMQRRHEQELEELRRQYEDGLDDLAAEIDLAADIQGSTPPLLADSQQMGQRLSEFNPQITVFSNFLGRTDDKKVFNEDGDRIDDRFNLREVEVDFRAAVGPWADAVAILTLEAETPGDYHTTVEEGYLVLKQIPGLDAAPLGLRLKTGRFRPEFGRFNRIHLHDLPFVNYPGAFQEFLGEEGFIQDGVSASVLWPTPGESNVLGTTAAVVNGGDLPVGADNDGNEPAFVTRTHAYFELAPEHTLDVGSSLWLGKYDADGDQSAHLLGFDATYQWKPFQAGEFHSFLLGGEVYAASIEQPGAASETPWGYFGYAQYQLSRSFYIGPQFDYFESIDDQTEETRQLSGYLTYFSSEFLYFRLGYEHSWSDEADVNGLDSVFFELNWIFGSHPVEPYWVNK